MQLQEAVDCLPSLVVFDNLHLLCPERAAAPEAVPSTGTAALVRWLCDVLDSFRREGQGRPPLPGEARHPAYGERTAGIWAQMISWVRSVGKVGGPEEPVTARWPRGQGGGA